MSKDCFVSLFVHCHTNTKQYYHKSREKLDFTFYIYIYAFSRRFYPKRLTLHSSYSFFYIWSALAFPGNFQGFFSSTYEVWAEKKCQLLHHVFPYPLSQKTHCHKRIPIPGTAACMWPFNQPDQITEQALSYLNGLSWVLQTNINVKSFFPKCFNISDVPQWNLAEE